MIARIKKLFSDWREDRRRLRALLIQLETLTDPTFLDRAVHGEWKLKNGIHESCRCEVRL